MPVEIVVPNEAEPGTQVPVKLYFSKDYVGRAVQATGYWYEGTGLTAYEMVLDKKGHPLGTRSGTVSGDGLTLNFGSVRMPKIGFTVGFHVTVSGNQFFIYDKVKPKAEEPQPPSPPGPEPPEPQPPGPEPPEPVPPEPGPEPQPQPPTEDKSSDALKLLGLGALALIILKSRG